MNRLPEHFIQELGDLLENADLAFLVAADRLMCSFLNPILATRRLRQQHSKAATIILRSIRRILHDDWDPIGMESSTLPEYEYDAYIGPVFALLSTSQNSEEVENLLHDLEIAGWGSYYSGTLASRFGEFWRRTPATNLARLDLKSRSDICDPWVLNQVGLQAVVMVRKENDGLAFFAAACFATALSICPSFVRAKRNLVICIHRFRLSFKGYNVRYLKEFKYSLAGISPDVVEAAVSRAIEEVTTGSSAT
jgi:hypothetical protein